MAVFSDFGLYRLCWKNYTKAHVYVRDLIHFFQKASEHRGQVCTQDGEKAPRTSPSHVPRPVPSFTLYFLLPPLSKIFTFCPMRKALLHLLFRCCVLKTVVSRWSDIWRANAYFMEWFICCCISPHFFWPEFYCRERQMVLVSAPRTKTFFSGLTQAVHF